MQLCIYIYTHLYAYIHLYTYPQSPYYIPIVVDVSANLLGHAVAGRPFKNVNWWTAKRRRGLVRCFRDPIEPFEIPVLISCF